VANEILSDKSISNKPNSLYSGKSLADFYWGFRRIVQVILKRQDVQASHVAELEARVDALQNWQSQLNDFVLNAETAITDAEKELPSE
jgi:hypothetical protein